MAKVTKASLIREYLPKHPDLGPSALAKLINEEHSSVNVTPQEVATLKSKAKAAGASVSSPAKEEPAKPATLDLAELVTCLRKAIDMAGKEQTRRLLDAL